jgi:hypothetical protein
MRIKAIDADGCEGAGGPNHPEETNPILPDGHFERKEGECSPLAPVLVGIVSCGRENCFQVPEQLSNQQSKQVAYCRNGTRPK